MRKRLFAALITAVMAVSGAQAVSAAGADDAGSPEAFVVSPYSLDKMEGYKDYVKKYQITDIQSYSNNGGKYGKSVIDKAFDGDVKTHWETGKANSASFTNAVTVTFEREESIGSMVFAPRKDAGNKGYPNEFSIYASDSESGDDFELVAKGKAETISGLAQFQFPETTCRRLKFVYDKAKNNWASAGEIQFFKADAVLEEADKVFTNGLMNELSEKYQDEKVLGDYLAELESHPLSLAYQEMIDTAKKLMNGESLDSSEVFVMSQRGNEVEERNRAKISYALHAFDPTGIYIRPGEVLRIYVDADENGRMPEVVTAYSHFTKLHPGYNEFSLPKSATGPTRIHLANRALPEHQAYAPRIRIEGGSRYPVYLDGKTNPETFMEELKAYAESVKNGETDADFAEISSENILIATSATGAYKGLKNQLDSRGYYADYTLKIYEDMYREYVEYSGFDYDYHPERPWNMRPRGKFILTVHSGGPFGWAQHGWTGYNGGSNKEASFWSSLVQAKVVENGGWAVFHEIGHAYDNALTVTHESTNNLYALYMQDKYLEENRMVYEPRWENHFTNYHNTKNYPNDQLFLGAITYQLEGIYGRQIHADAQRIARENKDNWVKGLNNKERMAVAVSMGLGINVLPHYEYYGIEMSDKAKSLVESLPSIDIKSYYANNKTFAEDKAAFTKDEVKPVISAEADGNMTLTLSVDQPDDAVLVYEIYRDGEFLGVTYSNKYVDKSAEENKTYEYTAVVYDRYFHASAVSDAVRKNVSEPELTTVGDIKVSLNSEFDPLAYVKAFDYGKEDISSSVKVVENHVDTSAKGTYQVTYQVADTNGNEANLTADVEVVAESVYLSDLTPSAKSGHYKKNVDASGNPVIRLKEGSREVPYYNGISAHANTAVTYNLEQDYEYFQAYIGLDDNVRNRKAASVTFEVYLDGEKVYDSGKITASDDKSLVKVPLEGAKTLKLVTTNAGDGNSYDHAMWADARLLTENGIPQLDIDKDMAVKVGETADINGDYSAVDLEDGDITGKVSVSGEVDFSYPGNYDITYSVSDSDGNTVTAVRTISVVNMDDFTYVSDYDWTSASAGWGSVKKDKSPSGNAIRLTDAEGKEAVFEKGLGAHANSKVVYDLTGIDAKYFSAYVGVDRAMYNSVGSVGFEVWLDDEMVYSTDVIRAKDTMEYIEVNLAGAGKLELRTNSGGNGNGSDHSVWGDAKFHYANPDSVNTENLQILLDEINGIDTSVITLDSVNLIHELQADLEGALGSGRLSKEEVDSLETSVRERLLNVKESQGKADLKAALDTAYDEKYDKYQALDAWAEYDKIRTVYSENYASETAFTEEELHIMTGFMEQAMEMLEREGEAQPEAAEQENQVQDQDQNQGQDQVPADEQPLELEQPEG